MATPPLAQQISNNNNYTQQQQQSSNSLFDQQNYNPSANQLPQSSRQSTSNGHLQTNEENNYYAHQYPPNTTNTTGLKACLKFEGNIDDMMLDWTDDERANRRRLVQFRPHYKGNTIHCYFNTVSQNDRSNNSTILSCIYWDLKQDFYITSVDCIYLLEALLSVRFTVEEKNRIRRNLEGFRPNTISKCKPETSDFFKLIMSFPNPKPRNIEKDVKVFPWKILPYALKKIIDKYTSNTGISKAMANGAASVSISNPAASNQGVFQAPSLSQYTSYASTPYAFDGQISLTPSHHGGPIRAFAGASHPYQRRYSQPIQHGIGSGNNRVRPLNIPSSNQFYGSIKEEPASGIGNRQQMLNNVGSTSNTFGNQNSVQDGHRNNTNNNQPTEHSQNGPLSARLLDSSSVNTPFADASGFKRERLSPSQTHRNNFMGNNQEIKNEQSPSAAPTNHLTANDNQRYDPDYMSQYNQNNLGDPSAIYSRGYNNTSGVLGGAYENNIDIMPPHPRFMESPSRRHLFINRRHSVADPYSIQRLQLGVNNPTANRTQYNNPIISGIGDSYNNEGGNYMGNSLNKEDNNSNNYSGDQIPLLNIGRNANEHQQMSYEQNENNANY